MKLRIIALLALVLAVGSCLHSCRSASKEDQKHLKASQYFTVYNDIIDAIYDFKAERERWPRDKGDLLERTNGQIEARVKLDVLDDREWITAADFDYELIEDKGDDCIIKVTVLGEFQKEGLLEKR